MSRQRDHGHGRARFWEVEQSANARNQRVDNIIAHRDDERQNLHLELLQEERRRAAGICLPLVHRHRDGEKASSLSQVQSVAAAVGGTPSAAARALPAPASRGSRARERLALPTREEGHLRVNDHFVRGANRLVVQLQIADVDLHRCLSLFLRERVDAHLELAEREAQELAGCRVVHRYVDGVEADAEDEAAAALLLRLPPRAAVARGAGHDERSNAVHNLDAHVDARRRRRRRDSEHAAFAQRELNRPRLLDAVRAVQSVVDVVELTHGGKRGGGGAEQTQARGVRGAKSAT